MIQPKKNNNFNLRLMPQKQKISTLISNYDKFEIVIFIDCVVVVVVFFLGKSA